jgi:hypothetical protein
MPSRGETLAAGFLSGLLDQGVKEIERGRARKREDELMARERAEQQLQETAARESQGLAARLAQEGKSPAEIAQGISQLGAQQGLPTQVPGFIQQESVLGPIRERARESDLAARREAADIAFERDKELLALRQQGALELAGIRGAGKEEVFDVAKARKDFTALARAHNRLPIDIGEEQFATIIETGVKLWQQDGEQPPVQVAVDEGNAVFAYQSLQQTRPMQDAQALIMSTPAFQQTMEAVKKQAVELGVEAPDPTEVFTNWSFVPTSQVMALAAGEGGRVAEGGETMDLGDAFRIWANPGKNQVAPKPEDILSAILTAAQTQAGVAQPRSDFSFTLQPGSSEAQAIEAIQREGARGPVDRQPSALRFPSGSAAAAGTEQPSPARQLANAVTQILTSRGSQVRVPEGMTSENAIAVHLVRSGMTPQAAQELIAEAKRQIGGSGVAFPDIPPPALGR